MHKNNKLFFIILLLFAVVSCKESYESKAEKEFRIVTYKNGNGETYYNLESSLDRFSNGIHNSFNWAVVRSFNIREKAEKFKDSLVDLQIEQLKKKFEVISYN